ncbi:MAG: hypothetical protein ACLFVF_03245 [Thiohalospira sp.]
MSSPGYAPPLVLEIGPSRGTGIALVLLYGAGALAPLFTALPALIQLTIAGGLLVSLRRDWRLHVRRSAPEAITALAWSADALRVRSGDGRWWMAEQRAGGLVAAGLVVLPLALPERPRGRRRAGLVIAADAVPAQGRRRLRMRLLNP